MDKLHIIKIGGHVLDDDAAFEALLESLASINEPFILVHGGGKKASFVSSALGIEVKQTEGRRITDAATLEVVVMVYAGLINKKLTAGLQGRLVNAIGLSGADAKLMISKKRNQTVTDYGFVGDLEAKGVNTGFLNSLLQSGTTPVIAPITMDESGQLLNTNADTIATSIAVAMAATKKVNLHFCFEKEGVLNANSEAIRQINPQTYAELKSSGQISGGMIPKLDNAFAAINQGVAEVSILNAGKLLQKINQQANAGTLICAFPAPGGN